MAGPAYGAYLTAAYLLKEGFDYAKALKDKKRAETKAKEGLKLSPEEKKALVNLRARAANPIPQGRLFNQGAKQIADTTATQKQTYIESATPYMEGSIVAKQVADTIDVKKRDALVKLSEVIATQNAQARGPAVDTLAKAEMQIGKAKREFKDYWDDKAYEAKMNAWAEGLDFAISTIGAGVKYKDQKALTGLIGEYNIPGKTADEKNTILMNMLPHVDNISLEQMMQLVAFFQSNPQALPKKGN